MYLVCFWKNVRGWTSRAKEKPNPEKMQNPVGNMKNQCKTARAQGHQGCTHLSRKNMKRWGKQYGRGRVAMLGSRKADPIGVRPNFDAGTFTGPKANHTTVVGIRLQGIEHRGRVSLTSILGTCIYPKDWSRPRSPHRSLWFESPA